MRPTGDKEVERAEREKFKKGRLEQLETSQSAPEPVEPGQQPMRQHPFMGPAHKPTASVPGKSVYLPRRNSNLTPTSLARSNVAWRYAGPMVVSFCTQGTVLQDPPDCTTVH